MKSVQNLALAAVPVVIGVIIAGWLMYQLRDVELIGQARHGFDA